jgi:RNA polymerase sigma-70 factor (ECF subfamily)
VVRALHGIIQVHGNRPDCLPPAAVLSGGGRRIPLLRTGPSALRMPWTDEELVAKSISGDADSFNELVVRWERPIYALAYRTIGREEDARDVCQETFLRAFRALPGFRGQAKFSSWLYRIALNLCRDWIRRERRTPVVQPPEDMDLIEMAAAAEPSESIEELVARKDLTRLVEQAMALLPEEQRTAIVLKEYHGLTFQEIAELVGCPLSTVKTRLYQGLTVLRRELTKNAKATL